MNKEYLLNTHTSKILYDKIKDLPIIDYHNHLSLDDIKTNRRYTDIYDLWIKPDPYKHRAMRMCGVEERYITGDAPDKEKFFKWCETLPKLIGNPLYVWSMMELERVFGIMDFPNSDNREEIYNKTNKYLNENEITPMSLLKIFNVELACPCVSLFDDVSFFESMDILSPSLRGDDIVLPDKDTIKTLPYDINNLNDYKKIISQRLDVMKDAGCIFTDHAIDNGFKYFDDDGKNELRFESILNGKNLSEDDKKRFSSYMLTFLCSEYAKKGLTVQLHIGAKRETSTRLRNLAGKAGGYAAIGNSVDIASLTNMLDTLEKGEYRLPKIVLFTLNPSDNAMISVLSGSYSKDGVAGLITQGPAWWWCDHKDGIWDALKNITSFGLLSNFIGMTTDSRSFLSFVRHDYFRRIVCEFLGEKYERNELMCDVDYLEKLLYDICYNNSKNKG